MKQNKYVNIILILMMFFVIDFNVKAAEFASEISFDSVQSKNGGAENDFITGSVSFATTNKQVTQLKISNINYNGINTGEVVINDIVVRCTKDGKTNEPDKSFGFTSLKNRTSNGTRTITVPYSYDDYSCAIIAKNNSSVREYKEYVLANIRKSNFKNHSSNTTKKTTTKATTKKTTTKATTGKTTTTSTTTKATTSSSSSSSSCTWCCGENQKVVNGGCFVMNAENCATLNLCDTEPLCKGKCSSSGSSSSSSKKYSVIFDQNYGYGLECDNGTTYRKDDGDVQSKCVGSFSSLKFPTSSEKMYNSIGYLLGWTETVENGKVICSGDKILSYSESYKVGNDTVFYACYQDTINGTRYALNNASADGQSVECGSALEITYCFKNQSGDKLCQYTKNGDNSVTGIVYRNNIALSKPNDSACDSISDEEVEESEIECTTKKQTDIDGKYNFYMCVDTEEDDLEEKANDLVKCSSGYKLDEEYTSIDGNTEDGYVKAYVKCVPEDGEEYDNNGSSRISLSVTSGNVNGTTGTIRVNATSKDGDIEKYYYSEVYKTPTTKSSWKRTDSGNFTITTTPGIIYIWVMDSEGNISSGVGGAVFDTINSNTTVNKLELYDSNGNIKSPTGSTAYKVKEITSSNYVRLSNNLIKDSVIADNGFNPYDMEYKLEVDTPTISVYATLTSTDSNYVSGYEPRTVNLEYGINTILIKIQNNEGKIRTYTILVTRKDGRTADNTLSDISVDVGNIEFNSNKAEYKIEIPKSTESVNVNATIASNKASFVNGYEPGNVKITSDATVKLIKVKSETGSTRTYVLTFVKEGTDIITDESLQLTSLSIPGVRLAFESEIANYNLSVGYSTDVIDLNTVLNNKDSKVLIKLKRLSDADYNIVSNNGINLDVGENFIEIIVMKNDGSSSIYRLTIIRKEFGLELENDTTLSDLKVLGYDIEFDPSVKEYTVRIKREKTLVITAIPNSTRSEVFIRGNDELTGFSTVRVKVLAENGDYETYSIDIKKDAFNKAIEIAAIIAGIVIILGSSCIIVIRNKNKKQREYIEE